VLRNRLLLIAATVHLALIVAISARDTFTVVREGKTLVPDYWMYISHSSETALKNALGQNFSKHNAYRQSIGTYLNAAGVEAGYGFFAPNIPGTNKISFELHYPDGRVADELPTLHNRATAFRLASLLDLIARTDEEVVREGLIKYLVYAVWREHPEAASIRAILGSVNFPAPGEYARGQRESYRALRTYDFTFEFRPEN